MRSPYLAARFLVLPRCPVCQIRTVGVMPRLRPTHRPTHVDALPPIDIPPIRCTRSRRAGRVDSRVPSEGTPSARTWGRTRPVRRLASPCRHRREPGGARHPPKGQPRLSRKLHLTALGTGQVRWLAVRRGLPVRPVSGETPSQATVFEQSSTPPPEDSARVRSSA